MKVENVVSKAGNVVANQFIMTDKGTGALGDFTVRRCFQSYTSIIAVITTWPDETRVEIDAQYWDYSNTTSKYRAIFLGETTKETQKKIASGEYILTNLNE